MPAKCAKVGIGAVDELILLLERPDSAGIVDGQAVELRLDTGLDLGREPIDPLALTEYVAAIIRWAANKIHVEAVGHGVRLAIAELVEHEDIDLPGDMLGERTAKVGVHLLDADSVVLADVEVLGDDGVCALWGASYGRLVQLAMWKVLPVHHRPEAIAVEVGAEVVSVAIKTTYPKVEGLAAITVDGVDVKERR